MVLFRRLVPENDGQYAGVILAVLLVGMLATALRLTRNTWEALERMRQSKARTEAAALCRAVCWLCRVGHACARAEMQPRFGAAWPALARLA